MISLIIIVFVAWYVFKTARETGKNGLLWAVITVVAYFGVQILVGLLVGLVIALGINFWGWSADVLTSLSFAIGLISFLAGLGVVYFIYGYVSRIPDDNFTAPPAPPKFDN